MLPANFDNGPFNGPPTPRSRAQALNDSHCVLPKGPCPPSPGSPGTASGPHALLWDYQAHLMAYQPPDPPQGQTASEVLHQLSRASAAWIDTRFARHCSPNRKRKYFDGWSPDAMALIRGHLRGLRGMTIWTATYRGSSNSGKPHHGLHGDAPQSGE